MLRLALQMTFAMSFVVPLDVLLEMILERVETQGQRGAHQHLDEGNFAGVVVFEKSVNRITQVNDWNNHSKGGENFLHELVLVKVSWKDEYAQNKEHLEDRKPPGGVPCRADGQRIGTFTGDFTVGLARADSEDPCAST